VALGAWQITQVKVCVIV